MIPGDDRRVKGWGLPSWQGRLFVSGTPVPDVFLSEIFPCLTDAEVRLMLAIYRHTLGEGRDEVALSVRQLSEYTGLSRTAVNAGLWKLWARRLIDKTAAVAANGGRLSNIYRPLVTGAEVR
jgi:hypothetical protein